MSIKPEFYQFFTDQNNLTVLAEVSTDHLREREAAKRDGHKPLAESRPYCTTTGVVIRIRIRGVDTQNKQ